MAVKYNGIEKYIWSDTYNFFLKHHNDSNTDESWNSLLEDARELSEKYNDHPLLRKILVQTIIQIESKVGGRYLDGKTYIQCEQELDLVI